LLAQLGRYRVIEEIGSGALSTIYKSVQEPLGRLVAVKSLKSTIPTSSPVALHLQGEARVLAELDHPNVVSLFDFVKTETELYLVLQYVDGPSLAKLVTRRRRFAPATVAALGAEVARGLEHIHSRAIVHGDLQPANILLSRTGDVKIGDFASAQHESNARLDAPPARHELPFRGAAYSSPEQILGECVDARSDLFALGVLLYEMTAGVRPFDADTNDDRATGQRIRKDPARPLSLYVSDVPRALERVVLRLLEKLPADRFDSAGAVALELEKIAQTERRCSPRALIVQALDDSGMKPQTSAFREFEDAPRAPRRVPIPKILAGFGALLALLLTGSLTIQSSRREPGAPDDPAPLEAVPRPAWLHVVATPWAEVWIDGFHVDTTPLARAIPLSAGTHVVQLKHPEALSETRTIHVSPGEEARFVVTMQVPATEHEQAMATPYDSSRVDPAFGRHDGAPVDP
jgi:serine/threonine-protein kinase